MHNQNTDFNIPGTTLRNNNIDPAGSYAQYGF